MLGSPIFKVDEAIIKELQNKKNGKQGYGQDKDGNNYTGLDDNYRKRAILIEYIKDQTSKIVGPDRSSSKFDEIRNKYSGKKLTTKNERRFLQAYLYIHGFYKDTESKDDMFVICDGDIGPLTRHAHDNYEKGKLNVNPVLIPGSFNDSIPQPVNIRDIQKEGINKNKVEVSAITAPLPTKIISNVGGSNKEQFLGAPILIDGMTLSADFVRGINSIADAINKALPGSSVKPSRIIAMMKKESSLQADARNRLTNASGINQIMPSFLKKFGLTPSRFRSMTIEQQIPYALKYYLHTFDVHNVAKISSPEELYKVNFVPGARVGPDGTLLGLKKVKNEKGKVTGYDEYVIARGTAIFDQNSGLDKDRDGKLSMSDLREAMNDQGLSAIESQLSA